MPPSPRAYTKVERAEHDGARDSDRDPGDPRGELGTPRLWERRTREDEDHGRAGGARGRTAGDGEADRRRQSEERRPRGRQRGRRGRGAASADGYDDPDSVAFGGGAVSSRRGIGKARDSRAAESAGPIHRLGPPGSRSCAGSRSSPRRSQDHGDADPHGRLRPVSHPSLGLRRRLSAGDTTAAGAPEWRARLRARASERADPQPDDARAHAVSRTRRARGNRGVPRRFDSPVSSGDTHAMARSPTSCRSVPQAQVRMAT